MIVDAIRSSIWLSNVNTLIGSLLLGSCALWAAFAIVQTAWQINPLATAFAAMVEEETVLPD